MGFDKDNVIYVINGGVAKKQDVLKQELGSVAGVQAVSACYGLPGLESTRNGYRPEGQNQSLMYNALYVDDNFMETFGIQLKKGRAFYTGVDADKGKYLINETLAKQLNWDEPLGKNIFRDGDHEVIGVVKDFQLGSVYEKNPPLIISKELSQYFYVLSIKLSSSDIRQTIKDLEKKWGSIFPNDNFSFSFYNDSFTSMYSRIIKLNVLLSVFTILAIVISLLGLIGVTLLQVNSLTKEIGVRKVNGARVIQIISLINISFMRWLILALIFAIPLSAYIMNIWLSEFAYKTTMNWWIFLLSGGIALLVASIAVSFQSWHAATRNPVEALKYE